MSVALDGRAVALAANGFDVHPLKPGDKRPALRGWQELATSDPDQVLAWWGEDPSRNIGVRVGEDAIVVDIDTPAAFDEFRDRCPTETTTARTPRGGWHLHFAGHAPSAVLNQDRTLEVKGARSNVVGVGSIVGGVEYRWEVPPGELAPVPAPPELIAWLTEAKPRRRSRGPIAREPIPEGRRNAVLTQLAGHLWRSGLDESGLEAALLIHNQQHCRPPLPEEEVRRIAASIARRPLPPPWAFNPWEWAGKVVGSRDLTSTDHQVLTALCSGASDEGNVTRGVRRLVVETNLSNSPVVASLKRLEKAGVVAITERSRKYGTTYSIAEIRVEPTHDSQAPAQQSGPSVPHQERSAGPAADLQNAPLGQKGGAA